MEGGKNSIYLIRHGESKFNRATEDCKLKEEVVECRFRKDLFDCDLTELGIQQAKETGEKLKDINTSLVLVSPLRRALQTAYYAFKDHPSKPKIKVILLGREVMGSCCSFPADIEVLQKEFGFDFSESEVLKDKKLWILETFEGEDRELLESLTKDLPLEGPERYEKFVDILVETARRIYPKNFESTDHLTSRIKKLKKQLKEHFQLLRESEKLAFVGHGIAGTVITATKFDEKGYALDGIRLKNAEFMEYFFDEEIAEKTL